MKKILFLTTLFICVVNLYSQEKYTAFGLRAAIGVSKLSGMDRFESKRIIPGSCFTTTNVYQSKISPAWDIGFSLQNGHNNFMFQIDYLASFLNTSLKNAYTDGVKMKKITSLYSNLAFNFGGKWIIKDDYRFLIGLGPYVGVDFIALLAGKDRSYGKSGSASPPYEGELNTQDADYKDLDWGVTAMAGIEYQNYQFAINYYHGVYNIVYDEYPLHNRALKISFTYFFDL